MGTLSVGQSGGLRAEPRYLRRAGHIRAGLCRRACLGGRRRRNCRNVPEYQSLAITGLPLTGIQGHGSPQLGNPAPNSPPTRQDLRFGLSARDLASGSWAMPNTITDSDAPNLKVHLGLVKVSASGAAMSLTGAP